jgi:hypothetical protein
MTFSLKSKLTALTLVIAGFTGTAIAQDYTFNWNPRTGDVWVDSQLNDVNRYGTRYREPFVDEMVRYYGAPRDLVNELLVTRRWAPGDVYYACSIAHTLGRPCRYVVNEWDRNHGKGWGVVAKELGIKPGSAEFHRLKRGFVPTYDRWARPIDIDADLRRDFPNRGHAKVSKDHSDHGKGHADVGHSKGHATDHRHDASPAKGKSSPAKAKHDATSSKGKDQDKGGKGNSGKGKGGKG